MLTAVVLALLVSPVATAAPRAALAPLPGVGVAKSDAGKTLQKARAELVAAGYDVVLVDDVAPECAGDAACLDRVRAGAGADLVVTLELLRVGPVVQLASSLQAPGAWVQGQRTSGVTPWSEPRVLPDEVLAEAAARAPAATRNSPASPPRTEPAPEPSSPSSAPSSPPASTPSSSPADGAPVEAAASSGPLSTVQAAGVGVGGLGAAVIVVGAVVSGAQYATMNDPQSLGSAKEDAVVPFWVGVGVAGAGAAALVAGVVVAVLAPAP